MGDRGLMARVATTDPRFDPSFPRLKSLVIERTGHFYYQDKDDLLWDRVRRRIQAVNAHDCAGYIERLTDDLRGDEEWSKLESEITIGETFFFRYAEQFAALRQTILPAIIEKNRETRRIRIWSAGCATGAEPYSVAILLTELLGAERDSWRIGIVGTDINEAFLGVARQARFGKWAMRTLPAEERSRYFLADREEPNLWLLRPEFRSLVRFERHNLLSLLDGTSPLQFTDFDLILCRNVLIYFHPETVVRIVGALGNCLVEDGWLLIGHAEPNPAFASLLQVVNLPGTAAYRRPPDGVELQAVPAPEGSARSAPPAEPQAWTPIIPQGAFRPAPKPEAPQKAKTQARKTEPAARPSEPSAGPDALLREIRQRANGGAIKAAHALCETALLAHPMSAVLHFYHGLLAQEMDLHHDAEKAFRRSIYLDKNFVMAHYHLGLLLIASGRHGPGRQSLANAARLAAGLPEDQILPEGDGATAGHMRDLVRFRLEALTRAESGR
jgi:chemotaxis protein methyltransferase CheR